MKKLADYDENIHSCSKCGLCQAVCPVYKITGNDCTVSRGHFIMLRGLIKGELKMSKRINHYLDLCLKCGACSKFCPSGIDIVDIIASAKAEYFKQHPFEKVISFVQEKFILNLGVNTLGAILRIFSKDVKSKSFETKVVYFGGCGGNIKGNASVVKLLNFCNIEVISPKFNCCGIPFYTRGDFETYSKYRDKILDVLKEYEGLEVVTTCASCEKTLKKEGVNVKNIFEYIKENDLKFKLKKNKKVTFHKPCNIDNFDDIEWILKNTENLEYIEMQDYDKCCGLNGIFKPKKTFSSIWNSKHLNILNSGAKTVLTSCLGCEFALTLFSKGKYKVEDFAEFLAKNICA